jgi:hypothetical protein
LAPLLRFALEADSPLRRAFDLSSFSFPFFVLFSFSTSTRSRFEGAAQELARRENENENDYENDPSGGWGRLLHSSLPVFRLFLNFVLA